MDTASLITTGVIVAYLVLLSGIGIGLNRRNRRASDWDIGGGTLGVLLLAAGIAGTRIGGAGTYGVAGDVIATGIGNLWYGINTFAALALVGLFFAIPYRRLKLASVGEVFRHRFGSRRCQWLTSLCVQAEYLVVNIIEPYVIGTIISGVTGLPFVAGVFIGGFLIILVTVTGGLRGTAITNIVHCTVIIVGLALVGLVAAADMGGWEQVVRQADLRIVAAGKDAASWWRFTGIGWASIIALFIAATIHTPAASVYANYASSARKQDFLIPAFLLAGVIAALMPLVAGFIGIQTIARYGAESGLSGYQNIAQLAIDTGPVLGGIALAAVLAAVISSGSPILLASAAMFVNDWMPGAGDYNDAKKLRIYKIVTVLYGLAATCIAWLGNIGSVLQLLLLGYAMVVPPAIVIAFVFYWRRTTEAAAFWGMLAGFAGGLTMWLLNTLFQGPENAGAGGIGQYWYKFTQALGEWRDPSFLTLLLPLIVVPVMVGLSPPTDEAGREWETAFYRRLGRIRKNLSWE